MYIIMQILFYLFLAALLGGFIAWAFSLCNCNSGELQRELDGARAERDELAARLGARQSQDGGRDEALIASLEAQLSEARVKIADLEKNGAGGAALGLAGGAALGASLKSGDVSIDKEELETLNARNKYLESRVKFLEDNSKSTPVFVAKEEQVSNTNFKISSAGSMSAEELEAEIVKAGDGTKPKAATRGADADDLLLIDGVGPKNNAWLNENGIHYFWQIATMNPTELAWLANNLPNFGSRVYRENWVMQCANLAKGLPPR